MSYIDNFLNPKTLNKAMQFSKDALGDLDFDTIAVRGVSGLLVGAPLSVFLEKNLLVVRKPTESSHAPELVEGWGINQKILIVDDFVSSGNTLEEIKEAIFDKCDSPRIVGVLLYNSFSGSYPRPKGFHTFKDGSTATAYRINNNNY